MKVSINGREHETEEVELSYEALVAIVHPNRQEVTYTVTYFHRKGPNSRLSGSLTKGEAVWLREGMIFNVVHTGNA